MKLPSVALAGVFSDSITIHSTGTSEATATISSAPDHPVMRGTAQNPDVFFQSRERANPFYRDCSAIVVETMERFGKRIGRNYAPYEYRGAPDAERVIVAMGSACETIVETVEALNARGEKLGVVNVRLFRPFDVARFAQSLPSSVRAIA